MVYKRILIQGDVQGVFFRASTKEKADQLRLAGEVRNLADGSVEVLVAGEADAVNRLVQWCHEGPPRAEVSSVDVTDIEPAVFDGFRIVRR